MKGAALNKFLLQKQGKKWDSVPITHVSANDLAPSAFDYFRKQAVRTGRLDTDALGKNDHALLEKLPLMESGHLKRAAILLFHPEPERFFTGAYVKIGFFRTSSDLRFQDVIHGHLFEQIEKTVDLLLSKYLEAQIRYEGISRIEEYPYPELALREALINAIAHKDYSSGNPVQIKIYEDRIVFWNAGQLPGSLTIDKLLTDHSSIPFNPDIATTLFRAGLIEAWGRGTIKIIEECRKMEIPIPNFSNDTSGFKVEFTKSSVKSSVKSSDKVVSLIYSNPRVTIPEIAQNLEITRRAVEKRIAELRNSNKIKRIGSARAGYWEIVNPEQFELENIESSVKSSVKNADEIIKLLAFNPKITISQMAQHLNISERAIEKQISNLKSKNKIKRVGSARAGYWEVIEQ